MAVKELPLVWRACDEEKVTLSEGGAVATYLGNDDWGGNYGTLVTSGIELTVGKHYWEVELLHDGTPPLTVSRCDQAQPRPQCRIRSKREHCRLVHRDLQ
jgi:hypothetical protein